ncbi:MAG: hypothetical protein PVH29_09605 [Candidatus Zixiibacteriota bacterium]
MYQPRANSRIWAGAAAAAVAWAVGCGAGNPSSGPGFVPFENRDWGFRLEYPADWDATAGRGVEPLIVVVKAPGRREVIGSAASVVGAWSAAPLPAVAASFERKIAAAGEVSAEDVEVGGFPARAFEYRVERGGEAVRTRALVVRGAERYFVVSFSAYEGQYDGARPYFEAMEHSIIIR